MAPGGHESELWLHQGRHLDHAASPRAPEASTPALGLSSTQRAGVHAGAAAAAAVLAHGSLAAHSRNTVWSVSTNTSVPGGVHAPPMAASAAAMASLASAAVTPSPRCAASWNSRISRSGKLRRARLGCTNWLPRSGASTSCTKLLSPSAGVSEPVCFGMRRMRPDGDPSASQTRQTVCLVPAARRASDRASAAGCMPAARDRGDNSRIQAGTKNSRIDSAVCRAYHNTETVALPRTVRFWHPSAPRQQGGRERASSDAVPELARTLSSDARGDV